MVDALTSAALASRVPPSAWTTSSSSGGRARWLCVLEFDENRKGLVITSEGLWAWTSTSSDSETRLHGLRPPDVVGALPVLDLEPAGHMAKSKSVAALLQIRPHDLVMALPTSELIEAAIATRSEYWIDRALRWMEAGYWPGIAGASMQALLDDRRVSQNIRHRAKRFVST